jgi:hypothetical protein
VSLGNAFPPDIRRGYIEKHLVPGTVVRINVKFPNQTKTKYLLLVADEDPDYWTFIINTDINQFVKNRPELLKCQVAVDASNNQFLAHDSHVACHELMRMRREEMIRELMDSTDSMKGQISDDIKTEVIAAVKFAKTISEAEKSIVIAALGG